LERVVLDLVHRGRSLDQDVSVVCLERPGTLAPEVESAGAEIFCVNKPAGRRPETVGQLLEVFERIQPDVIHTHQIGALYYAGPAAKRAGVRAVVHTEHIDNSSKKTSIVGRVKIRLLWALAGRHACRFFGVSEDIVEAVAAFGVIPRKKLGVVRNGIHTSAFAPTPEAVDEARRIFRSLGIPEGARVVGSLGRLAEVKRHDLLIRGFAQAVNSQTDAHLVIVGDGPERSALETLATSLGLSDRVHFAGYRERPEIILRGMDVFALASRLEGLPLAILEAWAAGVPVVASRVGGVPALIDDGRTGLLFDSGDEKVLAEHLSELLADPDRARRIGEAGRARAVDEFDAGIMAANYDRHYREVVGLTSMAHC
jgi:glycosyltransferase involved in cell wall biosynthesis